MTLMRIALWGPLLVVALLVGAYIYIHEPFVRDGTELVDVPLSEEDPSLDRVGELLYLGGLDIPRMDQNIGGLSALSWDAQSGRLLAITDDARWVWLTLWEEKNRVFGIEKIESGALLGLDDTPLEGKKLGDSESLTRSPNGGWLIGFEREHRIWFYPSNFSDRPMQSKFDPEDILGELEDNAGVETLATSGQGAVLICAQKVASGAMANCTLDREGDGKFMPFAARPPGAIADKGPVPTDADALSDGTFLILFRSYSPAEGNTAAIVAYSPDGKRREVATFLPPLTLDNFEGLAVREEGQRTYVYIVSDDNFSGSQRTLLMKFELLAPV